MSSIGTEGDVVPNTKTPYGNITQIIMKACCSALELYKALTATDVTKTKLKDIHILAKSCISHALDLFNMKQLMLSSDKGFQGFKLHALLHTCINILLFGTMSFMDTNVFEHGHNKDGVESFQRTSKRRRTCNKEMTFNILKRKRVKGLKGRVDKDDSKERVDNDVLDRLLSRYKKSEDNDNDSGDGGDSDGGDSDTSDSGSEAEVSPTEYLIIPNQGHILLKYEPYRVGNHRPRCLFPSDQNIKYLHPLLSWEAITFQLHEVADTSVHGAQINSAFDDENSKYFFRIEHGLKVKTDNKHSGYSSSILFYSTHTYVYDKGFGRNRVYKPRFDSIEATVEDPETGCKGTVFRQILNIVSLNETIHYISKNKRKKKSVKCIKMFLICKDYMKHNKQPRHHTRFLPYDVYSYANGDNISFMEEDTDYVPACLIPLHGKEFNELTKRNMTEYMFWLYPLRYCDRSNWSDVSSVLKTADQDVTREGAAVNYNFLLTEQQLQERRKRRTDVNQNLYDVDDDFEVQDDA
jgi:hypothetical protein